MTTLTAFLAKTYVRNAGQTAVEIKYSVYFVSLTIHSLQFKRVKFLILAYGSVQMSTLTFTLNFKLSQLLQNSLFCKRPTIGLKLNDDLILKN